MKHSVSGCSPSARESDTEFIDADEFVATPPLSQESPLKRTGRAKQHQQQQQRAFKRKPNLLRLVKTIVKRDDQSGKEKRILRAQRTSKLFTGFFPEAADVRDVQLSMRVAMGEEEEEEEDKGKGGGKDGEGKRKEGQDCFQEQLIQHIVEYDIDTANFYLFLKWPEIAQRSFFAFLQENASRVNLVRFAYHDADWMDRETCNFAKWSCDALQRVGSVGQLMDRVAVSGS